MAEGATGGAQHRLRRCHIPILRGALARQGDVEIRLAAQDRGNLAAHTADRLGVAQGQGRQQLLEPLVAVVAAGHEHQLAESSPATKPHRAALTRSAFAPGLSCRARQPWHHAQPQLLQLRQQHHPQHRLAAVHQGQMHRIFARALQEVFSAIEGIEDPQPLRRQGLAFSELLLGGFLAQHGPRGRGEGCGQALQQPLVHRQIRRTHRALAALIHAQRRREAIGGLLASAIGQQDVGRAPAQPPQLHQQGFERNA